MTSAIIQADERNIGFSGSVRGHRIYHDGNQHIGAYLYPPNKAHKVTFVAAYL